MDIIVGKDEDMEKSDTDCGFLDEEFNSFMAVESLNVSIAAGVLLQHLTGTKCCNNGHNEEK